MKTIKEAADSLEFNKGVIHSNPYLMVTQSFESGVEFAQRWIPIEEELPILHDDVILKCKSGFWDKGFLIHQSGDNMFASSSGDLDIVTHWRPISFL